MKKSLFLASAVLASTTIVAPTQAATINFEDLKNYDDTTQKAVQYLVDNKIVQGTSSTTFSPKLDIRRGQVVKMIGKYLKENGTPIPSDWQTKARFKDLPVTVSDKELLQYAAVVYDSGVFLGNDGVLNSAGVLTRENVALVLNRLAANVLNTTDLIQYVKDEKLPSNVKDIANVKDEAKDAVLAFNALGISNVDTFNPKASVQRVHFASFLAKMLQKFEEIKKSESENVTPTEPETPVNPEDPKPTEPETPVNPDPSTPTEPTNPDEGSNSGNTGGGSNSGNTGGGSNSGNTGGGSNSGNTGGGSNSGNTGGGSNSGNTGGGSNSGNTGGDSNSGNTGGGSNSGNPTEPETPVNPDPPTPTDPEEPETPDENEVDPDDPWGNEEDWIEPEYTLSAGVLEDAKTVSVSSKEVTLKHSLVGTATFAVAEELAPLFSNAAIFENADVTFEIEEDIIVDVTDITIKNEGTASNPLQIDGSVFPEFTNVTVNAKNAYIVNFGYHLGDLDISATGEATYTIGDANLTEINGTGTLNITFDGYSGDKIALKAPLANVTLTPKANIVTLNPEHNLNLTINQGATLYEVDFDSHINEFTLNGKLDTLTVNTVDEFTLKGSGNIANLFGNASVVYASANGVTVDYLIIGESEGEVTIK